MRAFIGLGGNIGEPAVAFRAAVAELRATGQVVRVSSLYDSAPRNSLKQPHFLNAALELETDLSPIDLLAELKRLEQALGRDLGAPRWSPRPIDLDILSFDGMCVTDPEHDIIVPHPRFHERRFALEPVAELDPGLLPGATARTCASTSPSPTCWRPSPTRRSCASAVPPGRTRSPAASARIAAEPLGLRLTAR